MSTLRYITAGESHGKALTGILEGIPSGLKISSDDIDGDLKRRQGGYGRGGRMKIESDRAAILSGVRWGKTIGSPVALMIENKDYKNWHEGMSPLAEAEGSIPAVTRPRPGHADLAGAMKYDQQDIRNILERSSARETAMRVALGAVTKRFLSEFGISVGSFVIRIGNQKTAVKIHDMNEKELLKTFAKAEKSVVRCPDEAVSKKMARLIARAMKEGNSLGGTFEVFVTGVPAGLGSHIQWDRRLDGKITQAVMSIQAMKGVEIGLGFEMGRKLGSEVMDEILYTPLNPPLAKGGRRGGKVSGDVGTCFSRKTNFAGGIEGGITNGMPIIVRAVMKPIPTQRKPLRSVDIITKKSIEAAYERSDICAVPAAGVIGEAMVALTIAEAFLEKFGGDSMGETRRNYDSYMEYVRKF
ncbi:MAG: chorismate synthase [Thermodesulfovibrionales bacterium]|nr:chorismate synthase [Thermodesulfovibrionales bacterium]